MRPLMPRLIPEWRQAWRWSSVRLLGLAAVVQTALLAFPAQLAAYVPQPVLAGLATFALVSTVMAGFGRITTAQLPETPHVVCEPSQPDPQP